MKKYSMFVVFAVCSLVIFLIEFFALGGESAPQTPLADAPVQAAAAPAPVEPTLIAQFTSKIEADKARYFRIGSAVAWKLMQEDASRFKKGGDLMDASWVWFTNCVADPNCP